MTVVSPTYQLSDEQSQQIEDLLPANGQRGGQWHDHRLMIDGILWILSDGGRWRNLPDRYGPWQTVYDRFASGAGTACGIASSVGSKHARCKQATSIGACSPSTAP